MKRFVPLVLLITVLLTGCRETLTEGSDIYVRKCSACHGVDLAGGVGEPLDAGSQHATLSDLEYRTVIREGTNDMPANGDLTDQQVDALIEYIRQVQAE